MLEERKRRKTGGGKEEKKEEEEEEEGEEEEGEVQEDVESREHHNGAEVRLDNEPNGEASIKNILNELNGDQQDPHHHGKLGREEKR